MGERQVSCAVADVLRPSLSPFSSLTNYVGGQVLNPDLPPRTETTWAAAGCEVPVMREVLDAGGCRHYVIEGGSDE